MTERERAQDKLLCGIGFTLAGIVGREGYAEASEAIHELATGLKEESAKQDDEDNNGVRRVMGKKDCAEKVTKPGVCGKCGSDRFAYVVPGKWQCVKCGDGAGAEPPTPNRISACTQVAPGCRERCGTSELCDIKQD